MLQPPADTTRPKVSIITVNYNQTELTCALLDSIRRQDYRETEVIVVDNASREDPQATILDRFPEVIYLRSNINLGFAGGNNLGLTAATGDFYFFVNNDAELTPACIGFLLDLFRAHPKAGIVSPLICYARQPDQTGADIIQYAGMTPIHPLTARNRTIGNKTPDLGQFAVPRETHYAHGAAMMLPRRILDKAGRMAEDFFLYYEELDWCERIRGAGYEAWVEPRAKVYHKESMSVQKLGALKTYFLNRNRVYFMRRHCSGWKNALFTVFLLLVTAPKNTLVYLLRGETDNLRAFWQGIGWNFGLKNSPYERFSTPSKG